MQKYTYFLYSKFFLICFFPSTHKKTEKTDYCILGKHKNPYNRVKKRASLKKEKKKV